MNKKQSLGHMLHRLGGISLLLVSFCGTLSAQSTDMNKMKITRSDDNAWYVKVKADAADQEKAWIDWNNNGTFDGEDEKIDFNSYAVSHDVVSRTITVYGNITQLSLPYNKVTKLDVTSNPSLTRLFVNNNLLTQLDLSGNPKLEQLYCYNNSIENLDLSHNPDLYRIACYTNHIQDQNMVNLVNSIPSRKGMEKAGKIHITNSALLEISLNLENVCTKSQVALLNEKNWAVYDWKDGENEGENLYDGMPDVEKDNFTTDLPKITLTSSENTGSWYIFYDVPEEFRGKCWIDVNDNKKYDEGEEIRVFNTSLEIARTSSSLDMYGMFSVMICTENKLTGISLTQNQENLQSLDVQNNALEDIDLSDCKNLVTLNCDNNKITSLDVSGLAMLEKLNCQFNGMTAINTEGCNNLKVLNCSDNKLSAVDVSSCVSLEEFLCSGNTDITSLDLSKNTGLRSLYCNNMQLTSLNLDNNTILEILYCLGNKLTELSVDKLPLLRVINCGLNNISSINFDNNPELTKVYVYNNALTDLNLNDKTYLSFVDCCDNKIQTLSFQNTTGLVDLHCSNNQLETLTLDSMELLQRLVCNNNKLTQLNTEDLIALEGIRCENNQINELAFDFSELLRKAYIYNNNLSFDAMSELVSTLPSVSEDDRASIVMVDKLIPTEKNKCSTEDVDIAKSKGWGVYDNNGDNPISYTGDDNSAVESVEQNEDKMFSFDAAAGIVTVNSSEATVYTPDGRMIKSFVSDTPCIKIDINLLGRGTYLIKSGSHTFKMIR